MQIIFVTETITLQASVYCSIQGPDLYQSDVIPVRFLRTPQILSITLFEPALLSCLLINFLNESSRHACFIFDKSYFNDMRGNIHYLIFKQPYNYETVDGTVTTQSHASGTHGRQIGNPAFMVQVVTPLTTVLSCLRRPSQSPDSVTQGGGLTKNGLDMFPH